MIIKFNALWSETGM